MAEPESEPEPTAESELGPYPSYFSMPEAEPMLAVYSEPEVEPEPSYDHFAESTPEPNKMGNMELLFPPFVLVVIILAGSVFVYLSSHKTDVIEFIKQKFGRSSSRRRRRRSALARLDPGVLYSRLSGADEHIQEVVNDLERYVAAVQDGFLPIMKIITPCILTILLCPLLLLQTEYLKDLFWAELDLGNEKKNVNGALEVFLVPVSLLFTLLFTVAFESVLEKQREVRVLLNKEVNILYKTKALVHNISSGQNPKHAEVRLEIATLILRQALDLTWQLTSSKKAPDWGSKVSFKSLKAVSEHILRTRVRDMLRQRSFSDGEEWVREWVSRSNEMMDTVSTFYEHRLWTLMSWANELTKSGGDEVIVDNILLSKLIENIMEFGDVVAQRRAMVAQKLSWFQWGFMEGLGFIAFVAVLLIDADSAECELAMCMVTAFSVALMTLVVADGDDPYHGFIKVKVPTLAKLVRHSAEDIAWMKRMVAAQQSLLVRQKGNRPASQHHLNVPDNPNATSVDVIDPDNIGETGAAMPQDKCTLPGESPRNQDQGLASQSSFELGGGVFYYS